MLKLMRQTITNKNIYVVRQFAYVHEGRGGIFINLKEGTIIILLS